jgi:hypothetical protein
MEGETRSPDDAADRTEVLLYAVMNRGLRLATDLPRLALRPRPGWAVHVNPAGAPIADREPRHHPSSTRRRHTRRQSPVGYQNWPPGLTWSLGGWFVFVDQTPEHGSALGRAVGVSELG